jgi:hypothetical protein
MRSAEALQKLTSLQWALVLASLVVLFVGALRLSSADLEPGLFGVSGTPESGSARAADVVPPTSTATSSGQLRMWPSQKLERVRVADCHPPKLVNRPRAEC